MNADEAPRMSELVASGPVLVHFFDFAQLNSVRALPYVLAWHERYREVGLAVLGIHSPRFPFTAERAKLGPALGRLGIEHPVADDSRYAIWHDYGCRGWPSLFLWGRGGALAWAHLGEGEYESTEEAIQGELRGVDATLALPAPLEPMRPTDAPGARVMPPTEEVFPGGSPAKPWRGGNGAGPLAIDYEAGGAHASVNGEGNLLVALDGGEERRLAVGAPGIYELTDHPSHERHSLRLRATGAIAVHSISFSAGVPS